MKSKILSLLVALGSILLPNVVLAQENDDMYFSRKDRDNLYVSAVYSNQTNYTDSNSEYTDNHNFNSPTLNSSTAGSPTIQSAGKAEDDNNQYFIKDYSIKNKTDNEVKTYSGINSNNGFHSGINVIFTFGSFYNSPFSRRYGYYNPYNDPFSPYYDPFYRYYDPWYYTSYRYDPWRYYRNNSYGYNSGYYNSVACIYPTNGYTNYSSNTRNEVRYRNGRKIISGSRSSRSDIRNSANSDRGHGVVNSGKVSKNGRRSGNRSTGTYRKYSGNSRNGTNTDFRSNSNRSSRSSSYIRTNGNNNAGRSSSYRSSKSNNRSNSYRSSGSSSGSRSGYSSGSRSSGSSSKPSSGSSRSSGNRKGRGN